MPVLTLSADRARQPHLQRFVLRALLVVGVVCCFGLWLWQQPYQVETPERVFAGMVDGAPTFGEGRRVETFRRRLLAQPVRHGPTRLFDADGDLIFEEHWRHGVRHELEFDRGRSVRYDEAAVRQFMVGAAPDDSIGMRLQDELQRETQFDYQDRPLREVVEDISFRHDIPIRLDHRALRRANISLDTPTTSSQQRVSLFAALTVALAPLDLTCAYRYEQLWVTTRASGLSDRDRTGLAALDHAAAGELAEKLAQDASVAFVQQPFPKVLRQLADRFGLRIVNQTSRLDDSLVTVVVRGSLRSVLGVLLYEHGLACEIQDAAIVIRDA